MQPSEFHIPPMNHLAAVPVAGRRGTRKLLLSLAAGLAVLAGLTASVHGQLASQPSEDRSENPVFVDEPPAVIEGLSQIQSLKAAGNTEQAAWLIHRLLEQSPSAVIKSTSDPRLHEPLRRRLLNLLKSSPDLLTAYRDRTEALAQAKLEAGDSQSLIRTYAATQVGLGHLVASAKEMALQGHVYAALQRLDDVAGFELTPPQQALRNQTLELIAADTPTSDAPAARRAAQLLGALGKPVPANNNRVENFPAPQTLLTPSRQPIGFATLSKPLATAPFIDSFVPIQPPRFGGMLNQLETIPPYLREGRFWPLVTSTSVVVMQDEQLTAFDRISLRPLWSIEPLRALIGLGEPGNDVTQIDRATGLRGVNPLHWEEVKQAAAIEPLVFAIAGRDIEGFRDNEGDELLIALDIATGQPRWYRSVQGLDESLATAVVRGPLVVSEGLLHLSLARRQPERRQSGALQAAVDPWTGTLAWIAPVGSSGALPFARTTQIADVALASEGIIYRSDRMGVIGAYRARDGLPLWVRTAPAPIQMDMTQPALPFTACAPVKIGDAIFTLDGSREHVLKIDAATGELLAKRKTMDLRQPLYLLACGEFLIAVDEQSITLLPAGDEFATAPVRGTGRLGDVASGIRGRVTVAGAGPEARVVAPVASGLAIFDPREPLAVNILKLDAPGSAINTEQGLLTIDDGRLHIYSTWDVASKHLRTQMAADPADPGPAAELLALADRATQKTEILPAATQAVTALEADGQRRHEAVRVRVVRSLLAIAQRSVDHARNQVAPPGEGVVIPADELPQIIELAQRISQTPPQRASMLLIKAEVFKLRGDLPAAMQTWHTVQAQSDLAPVAFDGKAGATTAGDEARRNMQQTLSETGRSAYAMLDQQFDEAIAKLAAEPRSPEVIDRSFELANQYRLALRGPEVYLRLAGMVAAGSGSLDEARFLERGIQHAERLGREVDLQIAGELNGRLIKRLMDRKLFTAAADALRRSNRMFAGARLQADGQPLDVAAIEKSLASELSQVRRWPRIALPAPDLASRQMQMLEGWSLLSPLMLSPNPAVHQFAVLQKGDDEASRVAVFAAAPGAIAGQAAGGAQPQFAPIWQSADSTESWTLLRQDAATVLFIVGSTKGARLVRVDLSGALALAGQPADDGGVKVWESQPFPQLFPQDPPLMFGDERGVPRMRFFLESDRPASELIAATDGRTIALIERTGRVASFDLASGQLLFAQRLPISNIADADLSAGRLIAAGKIVDQAGPLKLDDHALTIVDARSGRLEHVHPAPSSDPAWLRVTPRGDVIVGSRGAICSINPETNQRLWTVANSPAAATIDAWLIEDRLFVINDDRQLWEISALSGAVSSNMIDVGPRLDARLPIDVVAPESPGGPATLLTSRGVNIIGTGGQVVGGDGLQLRDTTELSAQPACVDQGVLMVGFDASRATAVMTESASPYRLWLVESATGKLSASVPITIGAVPTRLRVLDGYILLSGASSTLIVPASPR